MSRKEDLQNYINQNRDTVVAENARRSALCQEANEALGIRGQLQSIRDELWQAGKVEGTTLIFRWPVFHPVYTYEDPDGMDRTNNRYVEVSQNYINVGVGPYLENVLKTDHSRKWVEEEWNGSTLLLVCRLCVDRDEYTFVNGNFHRNDGLFRDRSNRVGIVIEPPIKPTNIETLTNVLHEACITMRNSYPYAELERRSHQEIISLIQKGQLTKEEVPDILGIDLTNVRKSFWRR